jgi:hypothetical protein
VAPELKLELERAMPPTTTTPTTTTREATAGENAAGRRWVDDGDGKRRGPKALISTIS